MEGSEKLLSNEPMSISETIKYLRSKYIHSQKVGSYFEINNGLCEDFALDIIELMGGYTDDLYEVETRNFMEGDAFDVALLKTHWNITAPPDGLTWDDINASEVVDAPHVWIVYNNRHYDAECPDGVDSFFDLPLFRRYIVYFLREKGIAVDEVMTDDIKPCPLCPISNPTDTLVIDKGMDMTL